MFLDRSEAAPRFIVKPFSTMAIEGRSATFDCRVIAPSPPVVSWYVLLKLPNVRQH